MELSVVECDGVMRLPHAICEAARLQEGTILEITITNDGILLRTRQASDDEQTWPHARERLSRLEIDAAQKQAAQSYRVTDSNEEFFQSLAAAAGEHADV